MQGIDALRYRNELKFICRADMLRLLEHRLTPVTALDRNAGHDGRYAISSLYFDDPQNSCCHDNDLGVGTRSKYRIRMYDYDSSRLRLERKVKNKDKCAKLSCALSGAQYQQLVAGDGTALLWDDVPPLLRSFALLVQTKGFRPKVIVDYRRKAFIAAAGNVRVTMDTHCCASHQLDRFLTGDGTRIPIQQRGIHLLEVKFDEFLPEYIRQTLQINTLRQTPFSKYYLSRQLTQQFWR
ncbi:MAG: polyphosphate polymerase domain-containing protein [Eubacteriales bacterium]|nr:polyphosphate polymerase domain-containing protein [Eubacteriales bacterium]